MPNIRYYNIDGRKIKSADSFFIFIYIGIYYIQSQNGTIKKKKKSSRTDDDTRRRDKLRELKSYTQT